MIKTLKNIKFAGKSEVEILDGNWFNGCGYEVWYNKFGQKKLGSPVLIHNNQFEVVREGTTFQHKLNKTEWTVSNDWWANQDTVERDEYLNRNDY